MKKMTHNEVLNEKEKIFTYLTGILDKDKLAKFMTTLDSLSDEEFGDFMDECKRTYLESGEISSDKAFLKHTMELKKRMGYNNNSYDLIDAYMLDDDENDELMQNLRGNNPTDEIYLDEDTAAKIRTFWAAKNSADIPSDIVFAHTIPLLNFSVCLTYDDPVFNKVYVTYKISDDYIKIAKFSEETETSVSVGAAIVHLDFPGVNISGDLYIPISVCAGIDVILGNGLGYNPTPEGKRFVEWYTRRINQYQYMEFAHELVSLWYGIQISMLHPQLKELYDNPKEERIYNRNFNHKINNQKNKTRIIKRHKFTIKDYDNIVRKHTNEFERKTLVWHVAGHWRHYTAEDVNGNHKKVFVQPYWKGPLKDVKRNLDDGRIREIDIPDED